MVFLQQRIKHSLSHQKTKPKPNVLNLSVQHVNHTYKDLLLNHTKKRPNDQQTFVHKTIENHNPNLHYNVPQANESTATNVRKHAHSMVNP